MSRLASSRNVQWGVESATICVFSRAQRIKNLSVTSLRSGFFDRTKKKMKKNLKYFWQKNEGVILHDGYFNGKKQPTSLLYFLKGYGSRIYFQFWDLWSKNWKKFRQLFKDEKLRNWNISNHRKKKSWSRFQKKIQRKDSLGSCATFNDNIVKTTTCGVSQITNRPRVLFRNLYFGPGAFFLFSWLSGDILASVSLCPVDDNELAIFWISGITLSATAVVIALFIWQCIIDVHFLRQSEIKIVKESLKGCLTSFFLKAIFSHVKSLYSSLWYVFVSGSSWSVDCSIASANSLSMGFIFSFPNNTSRLSKSDIMSIFLDFLAFAFCLLVEGIRNYYKRKK